MITQIKKGNKATYNGYLLGKKEYQDYLELKSLAPSILSALKELEAQK